MNNIPHAGAANNAGSAQRTAQANQVEGGHASRAGRNAPLRPAAAAAAEIGAQALRQGVRFSNSENGHVQEQIRTYVPGEPMTTENIAEGDRHGTLAVVLNELVANTRIPFKTQDQEPPQNSNRRFPDAPSNSVDNSSTQPKRSSDAAPSLPKRTSD